MDSQSSRSTPFGGPFALIFLALGLTSAGAWLAWSPGSKSARGPTPMSIQPAAPHAPVVGGPSPAPVLRPLMLLANAIGSEPLYLLQSPGEPALSDTYQDIVRSAGAGACGAPPAKATALRAPSPFNHWLLTDSECALIAGIHELATRRGISVDLVIATLPDWVDSHLQWMFDPMLDAIQTAAGQMNYSLSGFDLVDVEPAQSDVQPKGSVWPFPKVHELTPGALLFRRNGVDEKPGATLLLVLLVGETATGGVHRAALAAALDLSLQWNRPFGSPTRSGWASAAVRILGPTFSGSAPSLQLALQDAAARHGLSATAGTWFNVVTGSATAPGNALLLQDQLDGLTRFRAAVRSDPEEFSAIARFLGRTERGWQCGRHVGLLVEANTAWGGQVVGKGGGELCGSCLANPDGYYQQHMSSPMPCASVAHFPLHVSRLRAESQRAQAANSPQIARQRATVALDLGESVPPSDQVPAESPALTASTVETMVSGVFDVLNDFRVSAIGVLATDKRDHIYLAEEIARHRPDVLPFTLESSLLYLHPDAVGFVRGTLIASTYPLNPRMQQLTRWFSRSAQQFGGSPGQGIYNALALLLERRDILLDYGLPRAPSEARGDGVDCARGTGAACAPPVWVSVVGRDALLPLTADPGSGCSVGSASPLRGYVACRATASEESGVEPPAEEGSLLPHFLSSRHLPLLETALFIALLVGVQLAVYRWTNERVAAETDQAWSERGSWPQAAESWLRAEGGLARVATAPGPFTAERNAGLAAMRGATVVLVLWAIKAPLIYLSDAFGFPVQYGQRAFWVLAECGLVYLVWHVIHTFWPGARGWREILARASVLAFAAVALLLTAFAAGMSTAALYAGIAFGFGAALLAMFADIDDLADPGGRPLRAWRRLPVLFGLGAFAGLVIELALQHWNPVDALLYADRATDLRSFVSPTGCVVPVSLALFWWGIWNVHRVYLLLLPEASVGVGGLLERTTRAVGLDPKLVFTSPAQGMGWRVIPLTVVLSLVLLYGCFYVGNIEGRAFGVFLLLGPLCVAAAVGHTLVHSTALGAAVLSVLRRLETKPESAAFQAVGQSAFPWQITFREPRYYQLAPLLTGLERIARLPPGGLGAPNARIGAWLDRLPVATQRVLVALRNQHRGELAGSLLLRRDWEALDGLLRRFVRALRVTRWRVDFQAAAYPASAQRALTDVEYAVSFHAALVLRNVLTRLVSGFTIVFGALLLLLVAHLLYSFQGRVYWLLLDAAAIVITAALGLRLFIAIERDTVMSYIWKTDPGKISLFGGLTWRIVAYAAVSLGALFVVLFPELAGRSGSWLASAAGMLH